MINMHLVFILELIVGRRKNTVEEKLSHWSETEGLT